MEMEEEEMEREDLERDWRLKGERGRIWGKKKEVRWSLAPGEGEERKENEKKKKEGKKIKRRKKEK